MPMLLRMSAKLFSNAVCRSIKELSEFASKLSRESRTERLLANNLEDVIPRIHEAIQARERRRTAEMKKAALLEQMNTPRSLRPRDSIKPAKYKFDYEDEFMDEDESEDEDDASYSSDASDDNESQSIVRATRFSSRLSSQRASTMDMDA